MLTNENLVAIDSALQSCSELRLSSKEERYLEHKGEVVESDCDVYRIAQFIIVKRDKNRTRKSESLDLIVELAADNGCTLENQEPEKRETIPPIFCGGVNI